MTHTAVIGGLGHLAVKHAGSRHDQSGVNAARKSTLATTSKDLRGDGRPPDGQRPARLMPRRVDNPLAPPAIIAGGDSVCHAGRGNALRTRDRRHFFHAPCPSRYPRLRRCPASVYRCRPTHVQLIRPQEMAVPQSTPSKGMAIPSSGSTYQRAARRPNERRHSHRERTPHAWHRPLGAALSWPSFRFAQKTGFPPVTPSTVPDT